MAFESLALGHYNHNTSKRWDKKDYVYADISGGKNINVDSKMEKEKVSVVRNVTVNNINNHKLSANYFKKMEHKHTYTTRMGGLVCSCGRYFHRDHPEQLERHIAESNQ